MISKVGFERIALLRSDILKMARYIQNICNKSSVAMLERNEHQARDVLYSDSVIDHYQIELQKTIISLTGILTPTGKDLRFLTMTMSIVNTLERIGDKFVSICELAMVLIKKPPIGYYEKLRTMFDGVSLMLKGSIDNLVDPSLLEAERLCRNDSNIDSLLEGVRSDLLSNMEQSPSITSRAVDLLRLFCYLEEIADLCTELMEAAVYIDIGKHYRCINDIFQPVDFKAY